MDLLPHHGSLLALKQELLGAFGAGQGDLVREQFQGGLRGDSHGESAETERQTRSQDFGHDGREAGGKEINTCRCLFRITGKGGNGQ